jgi:hypothetical protein
MKKYFTRFLRSQNDFPCAVSLGGRLPAWEIKRFGDKTFRGKTIAPPARLRFAPDGEDDFSVRGDSKTVLYKGGNVSHRWTLLGKDNFEYDFILKKPPVSNVVSLTLEGAENFNFFRQPHCRENPFLGGSYAVYLKDTFIGQGTGKLCHIHRPKIIDAAGSSVWGELNIAGNKLFIIIPPEWLASAVYPVLVDPVVGCSAVGSRTQWNPWGDGAEDMKFAEMIPVNRYTASENLKGRCGGFFYDYYKYNNYESYGLDFPVLYSGYNGLPYYKKTDAEDSLYYPKTNGTPAGWINAGFTINQAIPAGDSFWFGLYAENGWHPCFDYGGKLFVSEIDYENGVGHAVYPAPGYGREYDITLSMYFEYSVSQNYIRTITQGITLSDSFYKRSKYRRGISAAVNVAETKVNRRVSFYRAVKERAAALFSFGRLYDCKRFVSESAGVLSRGIDRSLLFFVKIFDGVFAAAPLSRRLSAVVRIITFAGIRDYFISRFMAAGANLVIKSKITRELVIESGISRRGRR